MKFESSKKSIPKKNILQETVFAIALRKKFQNFESFLSLEKVLKFYHRLSLTSLLTHLFSTSFPNHLDGHSSPLTMNLLPNDLMYDTLIDLTIDLVVAALLAPGINVHLFPFIKSATSFGKEADLKKRDKNEKLSRDDDADKSLTSELSEEPNCETDCESNYESGRERAAANDECAANCEASHSAMSKEGDRPAGDDYNLEKATRLFGQIFESTKCYLNQMFENEPTEEFIKHKEDQLTKAHDFLTDVVLNQDPNFKIDNNDLNNSFKYLESEFKKLDQLKDSVKLSAKSSNSIESNLVPSYFENDSASAQSSDDDFEIIPSQPPYQ